MEVDQSWVETIRLYMLEARKPTHVCNDRAHEGDGGVATRTHKMAGVTRVNLQDASQR